MLKRVVSLKKKAEKLQSELYVTKNVNTLLNNEIDHLQHYQKHFSSMDYILYQMRPAIKSLKKGKKLTENLQFDLEEVNYQTDKYHMIGLIKTKGGTQATIFRFKTHSFTKAIY